MENIEDEPKNIKCLKNIKNLLDIFIKRGVIYPSELSVVGKIYDEFLDVLKELEIDLSSEKTE